MDTVRKVVHTYSGILQKGQIDPDFFEFIRCLDQETDAVGKSYLGVQESVRFGQVPYLFFPMTSIAGITEKKDLVQVMVFFMGLLGPCGPMPLEFTQILYQRAHNDYDLAPSRFLDIIHHKFIGLFYRAWQYNEQTAQADHPEHDLILSMIDAIAGGRVSTPEEIPTEIENYNADLFSFNVKSAAGLETLLRRNLHLPMRIIPHLLSRLRLEKEYRCVPGKAGCAELGVSMQLGYSGWSKTSKFLISTDVLAYQDSLPLMPGAKGFQLLTRLVSRYLDRPMDFDLEINLQKEKLPDPCLDGSLQLGRGIWLTGDRTGVFSLKIGASRLMEKKKKSFNGKLSDKEQGSWECQQ